MTKRIESVQLGSDIEFFLQDRETGEIVSAEGYAKGTKDKPFVFDPTNRFWATSLDNVAYEGNIPPVSDKLSWYNNINRLREYIDSTLPKNLITIALPSHDFEEKYLMSKNTRTFGCSETYCCWTRSVNLSPNNATRTRSTGKHIHASWDDMDMATIEEWIKAMDLFLGIPSVVMEPDNKRRLLYGKAGEFRVSENTDRAEYRVLSSHFASSKELIDYTFDQTQKAIDFVNDNNTIDIESGIAKEIVEAINNSDKKKAYKIIEEFEIPILA